MAKNSNKIDRSYKAYLRWRQKYKEAGYGLDRELTKSEYAEVHAEQVHENKSIERKTGKKAEHVAREIAGAERTFTRNEARGVLRRLKTADQYEDIDEEAFKLLKNKYKKIADIYGLNLTPEEAEANESARRAAFRMRGKEPEYTIQATARAKFFNELLDAGLSYKEADKVTYG